jgi:hypothetical protein
LQSDQFEGTPDGSSTTDGLSGDQKANPKRDDNNGNSDPGPFEFLEPPEHQKVQGANEEEIQEKDPENKGCGGERIGSPGPQQGREVGVEKAVVEIDPHMVEVSAGSKPAREVAGQGIELEELAVPFAGPEPDLSESMGTGEKKGESFEGENEGGGIVVDLKGGQKKSGGGGEKSVGGCDQGGESSVIDFVRDGGAGLGGQKRIEGGAPEGGAPTPGKNQKSSPLLHPLGQRFTTTVVQGPFRHSGKNDQVRSGKPGPQSGKLIRRGFDGVGGGFAVEGGDDDILIRGLDDHSEGLGRAKGAEGDVLSGEFFPAHSKADPGPHLVRRETHRKIHDFAVVRRHFDIIGVKNRRGGRPNTIGDHFDAASASFWGGVAIGAGKVFQGYLKRSPLARAVISLKTHASFQVESLSGRSHSQAKAERGQE